RRSCPPKAATVTGTAGPGWSRARRPRSGACSHCFCKMRCESKRSCARRETQPDSTSGQASQRGAWPFWPQPEGNGVKTAPLVVTLLAQAASLGVLARLNHPKKSLCNFLGAPVIGAVLTTFALAKAV